MAIHKTRRYVGLGSNSRARFRLFCLPSAGGGASVFRQWRLTQGDDLEVVAIELPGRETRIAEPLRVRVAALVDDLLDTLPTDRPYALFGHSMGGLIAFELARALVTPRPAPAHLFVSSFRAPHLPRRGPLKHLLSHEALVDEMRRMGGTPAELLDNPEALALLLPVLRADLTIVETYEFADGPPLSCSVTAFGGMSDDDVSAAELEPWGGYTRERFRLDILPGDHFYLYHATEHLLDTVRHDLRLPLKHAALQPR
jgi:medium-chain acyl-[acyl-carrier-protein] hydrolase